MKSDLIMAVNQICAEKDLPRDIILGAIEEALVHAYRRNFSGNQASVRVQIDRDTGELTLFCEKKAVLDVQDPATEIGLAEARALDPHAELDGTVTFEQEPTDFGRIAAQTAKQVILQRIHEAERDVLFDSFHQREGELISGTVQSIDYRTNQVTIALGKKAEGLLVAEDQLPNDRYRMGQSVRTLLAEVTKGTRGPQIRLSRSHRNMLRRLLEREVPEIYNGTVEIKSIAREPGQRSKVAVAATQPGVDPVGSCVGMRGTRIQNIVDELNGEKIDVVGWSADVRQFISNALSPARPSDTILVEDRDMRTAVVVVPDRQLSLAIGKEGQNARLAAKLTGWRIDIKSETEAATEGLNEMKRQQMQLIKARALEAKVATMPGDDLLSRAEWLLREKDKAAVSLEQAAQLLVQAEAAQQSETSASPAAEAVPVLPASPVAQGPGEEAAAPAPEPDAVAEAAPEQVQPAAQAASEEPVAEALQMQELDVSPGDVEFEDAEPEDGETGDAAKPSKQKKSSKKRELVYDEGLGQVVARKKRKPGRSGWSDSLEEF